jgi:prepilin-type N-terminal cleavage/methylation domain-containing protein
MKIENKKNFKTSYSSGFTLIELLAAVAIFSIVMIAVSGIFINAIKEQKIILAKQSIADNSRYAMDFMLKELRMARDISSSSKNGNFSSLTFTSSNCDPVCHDITYSFDGANKRITRNDLTAGTGVRTISSDEITVSSLNFNINDWGAARAPRITIFMKVEKAISASSQAALELQSTITPRIY